MDAPARSIDALAITLDWDDTVEDSPILQSQVVDQLVAMQGAGLNCGILSAVKCRKRYEEGVGEKLRAAGVSAFPVLKRRSFIATAMALSLELRRLQKSTTVRSGYVRGLWGALAIAIANPLRPISYVYDVRGDLSDESDARGARGVKGAARSFLERRGIKRASNVTAVSGYLRDLVRTRYDVECADVIPSCVPFPPESHCLKSGTRPIVLAFSGGLSHYQQVGPMLDLWQLLLSEPDVNFLLLTIKDLSRFPEVAARIESFGERLSHMSVPREGVSEILRSADVGFMLRDRRALNRAASPVKFAEYLAAGLAVVGSPETGDIHSHIEQHNVGTLVDPTDVETGANRVRMLLSELRTDRNAFRSRSLDLCRNLYTWESYANVHKRLYNSSNDCHIEFRAPCPPTPAVDKCTSDLAIYGAVPPPYGGVSVHVRRLASRLNEAGVDYMVYSPGAYRHPEDRVKSIKKGHVAFLRFLTSVKEPVVHLHTVNLTALSAAARILRSRRKRVIATIHNSEMLRSSRGDNRVPSWCVKALGQVDHFVAVSAEIQLQLESVGIDRSRVSVSPAFLPPSPDETSSANVPFKVQGFLNLHSPVIGTQGFFGNHISGEHVYGFELIAQLISRLKVSFPGVGVYTAISGIRDKSHKSKILQLRREMGIENEWMLFEGSLPAVATYRQCDLFLRPTLTDGDSVSVRECLNLGIPVVASDAVERPDGCVLYDNLDLNSLEASVHRAIETPWTPPVVADGFEVVMAAYEKCGVRPFRRAA